MANKFLISFTLFSLLYICTSALTYSLLDNAVNALSDSGYNSMSLTLEFGARSIVPPSPSSLTIFSPSDAVFTNSGQPSLNLLRFHFSPLSFPLRSLKSFPYGSKIPTLWSNHSLTVTSDLGDDKVEVNGIEINEFSVYDNGPLIIFGINEFLDPNLQVLDAPTPPPPPPPPPLHDLDCPISVGNGDSVDHSFKGASDVLRSKGYTAMASFLDLQLAEFIDQARVTVFAPADISLVDNLGNINEYQSIFFRHFVHCRLLMTDLASIESGASLHTYLDGFMVNVTRHGDMVKLNGVQVIDPEIYDNSWLAVHGLNGSFLVEETVQETPGSSPDRRSNCADAMRNYRFCFCFLTLLFVFIDFENTVFGVIYLISLVILIKCCQDR